MRITRGATVYNGLLNKPAIAHRRYTLRCTATTEENEQPSTSAPSESDDDLLIERQLAKRRPTKPNKSNIAAAGPNGKPKVISATRDQVYGNAPLTETQKFENSVVSFLGLLFSFIILEGVYLAASGFLPESMDQFGQNVVYPAFSPTLGLFLAASSLYGLWKTTGLGKEENK